jgi:nicotinamidase-related amidase
MFAGIVTNGGVASTVRDAHVRDFHNVVLGDGCGAFNEAVHDASIQSLGTIAEIVTCEEAITALRA